MRLTILKADAVRDKHTREFKASDYVSVSHLDPRARGTWTMTEMIDPAQQAVLARWANEEEKRRSRELAKRRHEPV